MILNLPNSSEYESVAKQCLTQAFEIIYAIDEELSYLEDFDTESAWDYHLGDLSTSLILIHQGTESLMKAKICEESPLLLLESRRTDWPTMPNSEHKDFNELFTIGGDALQRTYCAVANTSMIDNSLLQFIDEIRRTRNKIVHGVSREYLNRMYLVKCILTAYTKFLGRDSWWTSIRQFTINNPAFGEFNSDYEEAFLVEKLNYVEQVLTLAEVKEHFSLNLKSRRYYCPWCYASLSKEDYELETRWAILIPQGKTGATEIICINCQRKHAVVRKQCSVDECKGDVLYDLADGEKQCLTCSYGQ